MNFLKANKVIIIIVVVAIIIVLVAYFIGKANGKSPSNVNITEDIVGSPLSASEIQSLKGLAINMYEDMNGVNWNWNETLYNNASLLSDNKLVALNNIFNELYELDNSETFLGFLTNENFWWNDSVLQTNVDTIINRLTTLGAN